MEIKRDPYLNKLNQKMNTSMIKIITGIRRCGKSYLLNRPFHDYLIQRGVRKDHVLSIALDN